MMSSTRRHNLLGPAVLCLVLLMAPLFIPTYWTMILSEILIMGLMAISFNLLLGYTGLLSFGQGAFFGMGAYSAALMLQAGYQNLLLILLVGILAALLAALIVGFFSVRLDEIFFAMITLGFGMLFFSIAHNWLDVTGGSDGLPVFTLPSVKFFGSELTFYTPINMYYLVFTLVLVGIILLWLIVHSPFGLILTSLRENKQRVAFIGGNVKILRVVAFALSGAFTGLSGVLFCLFNNMATPEFMHWSFSAKPVIMSIIGGTGVFLGPLFGAAIFFVLEQVIIQFTENWMLFLGIVLVPIVLFFPQGVFGTLRNRFFKQGVK
ncbi:MAG: branched-chain amino acid ABC transporter permease [Desulfuromonadales bacterium]|nr:branched-chain amino acid ABC transporter permease [Desulfuromonadales bacterium]MBN2791617.1 branched-chain amino acid ABC transporter permease [Desulfuromonadales bacterium]